MANAKKGLGRGLNSLINGENYESQMNKAEETSFSQQMESKLTEDVLIRNTNTQTKEDRPKASNNNIQDIDIELICANPNQPRTHFDEDELEQLAASIKLNGLLQPISVTSRDDGKYEIIAGERRWRASKKAGLTVVPSIVREVSDEKKLELALIENLQRADLNPIEEAYCFKKILDEQGINQNELANKVSKSRSTVTNSLRLLTLPEDAQKMLYENKMTAGHARAILSVNTEMGQKKLAEKIINEKLTVREAESLANLYSGKNNKALTTRKPSVPKSYKRVAKALMDYIDTKVKVKKTNKSNKIEIEFKDEKDLERIYNIIGPVEEA